MITASLGDIAANWFTAFHPPIGAVTVTVPEVWRLGRSI